MAEIELREDQLIVHVKGVDQLWALKSQLEIPLAHIVSVAQDPETEQEWQNLSLGLRAPAVEIPGVLAAGSFYQQGQWVFWDVHHAEQAVTLRLKDEHYSRLVVEVDNPAANVAAIQQALTTRARS